ncbi:Protein-L-isoaspartate O-methyltransferase [Streptomyces sp. RB5]|uniref:Protein-L-isoaspartate O-methyltransferase n=1 Tax=Streptomyces smaragdinus TaxID=2585196 RepID=A0A7K0CNM3_9ACTN|nr:methyltransferase domain-containing protein [Streptomyces smaragdinus]MQY15078.1 Protein-L-isoaspartate O-methyltransferase [Streptomyces smaragdinus]
MGTGTARQSDPFAGRGAVERAALVRAIRRDGALTDPAWRRAFEEVPRHLFVPYYYAGTPGGYERLWRDDPDEDRRRRWLEGAYANTPLATRVRDGELISSSSQPSLMARMLEALDVRAGHRVLEIGAGTGYNAALLCHRLGDDFVTTVDLYPEITEAARAHLADAGHHPAVVTGDGSRGCAAHAPYDRIIATCMLTAVPAAWLAQCAPDALILAPLGTGLLRLRVTAPGEGSGRFLETPAYFVPLRGGGREEPYEDTSGVPRRALGSDAFRFALALTAGVVPARELYEVWEDAGQPERERFGVSVRGGEQWVWLDSADGPYRWPVPR